MKRRQQTTKQRENAHTERWLHVRIRIWTSGTPFGLWMALTLFQIKWSLKWSFRALRDCSVDCSKFYFYKCSTSFYDTILVTLELGLIEGITLTSRPPFPRPFQCWPRTWTIPPKTHYKTTLEERKTELCYPSGVFLIVGPQVLSFYPGFRNCLPFDWLRDCCDCEKAR